MESLVGRMLGKYQLTEMIGGGGMATVYEARHPGLDQRVAVKVLHPFLATDSSFVDRFRREAHAVAALRHPNIVRVLDSDHEEHLYYMVMEYIGGPTLAAVLSGRATGGGLSLPEVRRIIPPLCSAIDYAAGRGMVHRDIKPANIIMTDDGEPILTDYGIAKMVGSTSLTSPGTVVGSAHYMSPEQAQGQECDVRSDLYSLGIVLFECLAGTVPFAGDTTVTVLVKHISAPVPSIRALRPNLPFTLEPVLTRALAKLPRDRYELGSTFAEELVAALAPSKSTAVVTEFAAPTTPPTPPTTPPTPPTTPPTPPTTPPTPPPDFAPAERTPSGKTGPKAPIVVPPTPTFTVRQAPGSSPPPAQFTPSPSPPTSPATPPPPPPTPPPESPPAESAPLGATGFEAPIAVEPASTTAPAYRSAPQAPPASPWAEPIAPSQWTAPVGQYGQYSPPPPPFPGTPGPAATQGGAPPRRGGNRTRIIVIAAALVLLMAAAATAAGLALRGDSADTTTTTQNVTTTGTTALPTTSSSTTSTTQRPTTSTTKPTTTTAKPTTTTTAKPTTTTKRVTTTTKRKTTTTKKPITTQPTSPPGTIGPGTTSPPGTIGPGTTTTPGTIGSG